MTFFIYQLTSRQGNCIVYHLSLGREHMFFLIQLLCVYLSQNKCNVGYAFINMVDPHQIVPFFKVCRTQICHLLAEKSHLLCDIFLCFGFFNALASDNILLLLQAFNGKKWEKFNSEKVASLAYARIQGKSALIAHFQNSSLMNEDKRCRPILFHTEGPNAGDPVRYHEMNRPDSEILPSLHILHD